MAERGSSSRAAVPSRLAAVPRGGNQARIARMGTASIPGLVAEFAVPAIAGMLVSGAYNVIDSVFLGQALGAVGLSAMAVAQPIMVVFLALSLLIGAGGNALCALRLGEGRRDEAERILGNTFLLSIIMWVILAAALSVAPVMDAVLSLSSATADSYREAREFIYILALGVVLQTVAMALNNFIRTVGAPTRALFTMVIGTFVCIVLNYLFVLEWGWGVRGSAFATLAGQGASAALVLAFFTVSRKAPLRLTWASLAPRPRMMASMLALGLPTFAVQVGAALVAVAANMLFVTYGAQTPLGSTEALATGGVVQRVAIFTVLPLVGISTAIQPLLGYNYGARLYRRVRATLRFGLGTAAVLGTLMWLLVHLQAEVIVTLFGIADPRLAEFTAFALRVYLMMLPVVGIQVVGANYFQATGQPLRAVALSTSRQILFLIPLMFALPVALPALIPQITGLDAVYFAAPGSDALATVVTVAFLLREVRRLRRLPSG
ncbi:MATE family efflux transporter [Berryella wangjianweii]|nr:MATE family efflux transporter [Berryella wangjianweii]